MLIFIVYLYCIPVLVVSMVDCVGMGSLVGLTTVPQENPQLEVEHDAVVLIHG